MNFVIYKRKNVEKYRTKCDKITTFILILLRDFYYNNFVASKGKAQAANSVGYCVVTGGMSGNPRMAIEVRRVLMDKLNVAIADDNAKMTDMLGQMIEEDKDLTWSEKHTMEKKSAASSEKKNRMLLYWILLCRRWMDLPLWNTAS